MEIKIQSDFFPAKRDDRFSGLSSNDAGLKLSTECFR